VNFPEKKYQIIYADPPWKYNDQGCRGTFIDHYEGMDIEEIKKLPVGELADENCCLFLWATYPMLREALEVIDAWGFEYKSIAFQWIKTNESGSLFYGLGRWTRGNTEPCLLGVKDHPKRIAEDVFQIVKSTHREHSRKPDVVRFKILQLLGDLPRIELFARQKIQGWDAWGLEVPTETQTQIEQQVI